MAETSCSPPLPGLGERALRTAIPLLAAGLIRSVWTTARVRFIRPELMDELVAEDRRFLLAFWHSRLFLMTFCYRGPRIAAVISRHLDGELIARTVSRLGIDSVRGSSTRGGTRAMREALRYVRGGGDVGFTPDGPKGPARVVKPGVLELARLTGLPILPVSLAYSRSRALASWDRFEVPFPFSRVVFAYGETLACPRDSAEAERAALAEELALRLDALTDECRDAVGLPPWPAIDGGAS